MVPPFMKYATTYSLRQEDGSLLPAGRCCICERVLPASEFTANRSTGTGLASQCRRCAAECRRTYYRLNPDKVKEQGRRYRALYPERERERDRKWVRNNPDKCRAYARKMKYGIVQAQFIALLEKQNRACAICRQAFDLSKPRGVHVDHNHVTGEVRGLLCPPCNNGIGMLREDANRFAAAVSYLRSPPARGIC